MEGALETDWQEAGRYMVACWTREQNLESESLLWRLAIKASKLAATYHATFIKICL